jgi:hypothetical protein
MMSDFLRAKIMRKHKKDLSLVQIALEQDKSVTVDSLMSRWGWCRTRAHSMLSTAFLLGAIKAVPSADTVNELNR